jgi:6,7-dimethyl-8-ribityllumazine synthase
MAEVGAAACFKGIPMIFGVLTTDPLQQAPERAGIKFILGRIYGFQTLGRAA